MTLPPVHTGGLGVTLANHDHPSDGPGVKVTPPQTRTATRSDKWTADADADLVAGPDPGYDADPDPGYDADPDPGYDADPDPGYDADPDPEPTQVFRVDPEGRCAKAGISQGDLILAVHGVLCVDCKQTQGLLEAKDKSESIKVVFQDKYSR